MTLSSQPLQYISSKQEVSFNLKVLHIHVYICHARITIDNAVPNNHHNFSNSNMGKDGTN